MSSYIQSTGALNLMARPDSRGAWGKLSGRARIGWCPPLAMAFVVAMLIPTSASFYVGTLRLSVYRLFLIAAFIPAAVAVFGGRCGRVLLCDWLMLFYGLWSMLALGVHHGPEVAMESGGIYMVEGLGAYLFARAVIRDERSFRGLVALLTAVVIGLALVTIPESLTGKHVLRAAFGGSLTGGPDPRMGLHRSFASFDHPILYGVFCSSVVGLAWYVLSDDDRLTAGRLRRFAGILVSTIMSVSSGAIAAVFAQLVPIVWDRVTRGVRRRWMLFTVLFIAMWVAIDALSNRGPMRVLLTYLTFSSHTAYNRLIIWEYGSQDVWDNPTFGIGLNPWNKPSWMHSDSMDNFWLVVAVTYGLPAFAGLAGAVLYLLIRLGRMQTGEHLNDRLRKAWIISVVGMIIAGSTVHFWNTLFVHFAFLIGAGAWMITASVSNSRVWRGPACLEAVVGPSMGVHSKKWM